MGLCESVECGGDDFAGTAPCGVEVDNEEGICFEFVELREGFDFLHIVDVVEFVDVVEEEKED